MATPAPQGHSAPLPQKGSLGGQHARPDYTGHAETHPLPHGETSVTKNGLTDIKNSKGQVILTTNGKGGYTGTADTPGFGMGRGTE